MLCFLFYLQLHVLTHRQQTQTVFTGGEDGLIKAWRTPDVDGGQGAEREAEGQVERPSKKKMRKKDRANGDEGKDRFNPY